MKQLEPSITSKVSLLCLISTLLLISAQLALAAQPPGATTAPYLMTYTAKLVNATGVPVITAQSVRFSIWSDSDWDAGDIDGAGNINPAAPGFTGWQETYTITPNADGIFTVNLGSISTLPNFTLSTDDYLEVDVKPAASPNTAFEVLDPDGNTANLTDRKPINSSPYAINADTVDNRDAENTPNNIPVLDAFGKLIYGVIPDAVNANTFTLDQDNNSPADVITLQFGNTIAEFLRWNDPASRFEFSSSLDIDGDLSFSGTGNITGSTIDGTLNTFLNIPSTALAPYLKSIRLAPEYDSAALSADGTSNNGTMELLYENSGPASRYNYYKWTTNQVTAQDYDLVVRYQLPTDFVSFSASPLTLTYQTADLVAANNRVDLSLLDSVGAPVTLVGATALTSAAAWTNATITFVGVPTFTPGTFIEFTIKATSINAGKYARIGDLILNYYGR